MSSIDTLPTDETTSIIDQAAEATKVNAGKPRAAKAPKTKQEQLVALIRRRRGATIDEMTSATGWQAHSVRGAISGTLKKKLGLAVISETVAGRGRIYRLHIEA
jgi:glycine cleavage system aminomethyltransferase T